MNALALSTVDLTIIGVYFTIVLAIGLWIGRNTKSGEDLFLAGRNLGWLAIGFSLFASNISSTTLIGLVGSAYETGLAVSNYEWMATIVLVFFVFFFVPIFLKSRISTIPEWLERRYGRSSRLYFSGTTIVANVLVDTAGSLYAGAVVLKAFFPELELWYTCLILAAIAGVYTAAGGLAAVVYTDVIQAVVLLLGSCLITYFVFAHPSIDFSWAKLTGQLDAGLFSLIDPTHHPLNDPNLPWLGTLVGVPILGFYFWVTNQYIVQRVLGARSVDDARWGALLGGLLKLPVLFIMVLPGLAAKVIFPDVPVGDAVFPTLVTELLPIGAIGLVMAGLIAAIMSSIDSTLNSASALVTLDFVQPRNPGMSDKDVARVGRITMTIIMLFAAFWAPQIVRFGGLFSYLQEALAFMVPPVTILFLVGAFRLGGSGKTALITLVGGHVVSLGLFLSMNVFKVVPQLHFTLVAGIVFMVSALIYFATEKVGLTRSSEDVVDVMFQGSPPAQGGLKSYKLQSYILLFLTGALVVTFY